MTTRSHALYVVEYTDTKGTRCSTHVALSDDQDSRLDSISTWLNQFDFEDIVIFGVGTVNVLSA